LVTIDFDVEPAARVKQGIKSMLPRRSVPLEQARKGSCEVVSDDVGFTLASRI
jgi:hypothetical protein